jgi:monoamine oxidase
MQTLDVAIVGGGLAGLTAAHKLIESGHPDLVVLEARDRVGGRTLTQAVGGTPVDLGGQWIGPGQERMYALARQLELPTFAQFSDGKKLLDYRGRLRRYGGAIPRLPLVSLLELQFTLSRLEKLRARVPLTHPAAAGEAAEWDGVTVESWRRTLKTRGVSVMLDAALGALFGAEAGELSLLWFLFYLNSGGGLRKLIEIRGGAQQDRFVDGAQEVSRRLALPLGERLKLSTPVRAIDHDGSGVTLHGDGASFRARRCILAVPPLLAGRIRYSPSLPPSRDQLTQRMPMGHMTKVVALYSAPFWRARGLSGEAVCDRGPIRVMFDDTSASGHAALLGFIAGDDARRFSSLSRDDRRAHALDCFARCFGEEARSPSGYLEKDWAEDPWSGGCPVGLMGPGTLTRYGAALRDPIGRLHFAGTETSTVWCGYMEGAVASGERAAAEVVRGNH